MTCEHITNKQLKSFIRFVRWTLFLGSLGLVVLIGTAGWIAWRLVDLFEFLRMIQL